MGGGRGREIPMLMLTPALAIVGIETAIKNTKSDIPINNFFILFPPFN